MKARTTVTTLVALGLFVLTTAFEADAMAQQVECSSDVKNVTAVTKPSGHVITTCYQLDTPNLQPLLSTTIDAGAGCLITHLSGQVRITDNSFKCAWMASLCRATFRCPRSPPL